jgi:hypothetical protein
MSMPVMANDNKLQLQSMLREEETCKTDRRALLYTVSAILTSQHTSRSFFTPRNPDPSLRRAAQPEPRTFPRRATKTQNTEPFLPPRRATQPEPRTFPHRASKTQNTEPFLAPCRAAQPEPKTQNLSLCRAVQREPRTFPRRATKTQNPEPFLAPRTIQNLPHCVTRTLLAIQNPS